MVQGLSLQTRESWTCERRVVGKAEYLAKGENPRFIVTSLATEDCEARALYEDLYCARGEMENRIKEQQLQLFADRTSTHALDSNQLRLYFILLRLCAHRDPASAGAFRNRARASGEGAAGYVLLFHHPAFGQAGVD